MLNKTIWAVPRGRHVVPRGVQDKIWLTKKGNKRQGFCCIMTLAHIDYHSSHFRLHSPFLFHLLLVVLLLRSAPFARCRAAPFCSMWHSSELLGFVSVSRPWVSVIRIN